MLWIDFTRRNDPAHSQGKKMLLDKLATEGYPKVLCFWTKAPAIVASLYNDTIIAMQANDTLVLAQVTINNYFSPMEPAIKPEFTDLSELVRLISSDAIRIRFDPIIVGYTTPHHFKQTLLIAKEHRIKRIIINFLVPEYKGVCQLLWDKGFRFEPPSRERKIEIVKRMLNLATVEGIELAICAETAELKKALPQLKGASCADPEWATSLKPSLQGIFKQRPSRQFCGCVYSDDWGEFRSRGGYPCPHQCLYCYAK